MLRALALVAVVVLVNLPVIHETWTDHRIDSSGRDVEAVVVKARSPGGRHLVDYRLPSSVDPAGTTYSSHVDDDAYALARDTDRLGVRYVPGDPSLNRASGEVPSRLLAVIAVLGDAVLLGVLALLLARGRRWRRQVVDVDGDLVRFTMAGRTLVCATSDDLAAGLSAGDLLRGSLRLEAGGHIEVGVPVAVLEQVGGAEYFARGRVVDVERNLLKLQLDDGFVLPVRIGDWRNRADYRDHAEVRGTLVLTPRGT